ncbi:MAG: T9SS type A sorting domain-containing protein [Salibacteraceae bacterium]
MKYLLTFITLFGFFGASETLGQLAEISPFPFTTVSPTNTFVGGTIDFNVDLTKTDTGVYNGPITIRLGRQTGGANFSFTSDHQFNVNFAAQGDSVQVTFSSNVLLNNNYIVGLNELALVPLIGATPIGDTATFNITANNVPAMALANSISNQLMDTMAFGDTIFVTGTIRNIGNVVSSGPISLFLGIIDSTSGAVTKIDSNVQAVALLPQSDITLNLSTPVATPSFSIGGNGVVIWPAAPDVDFADTVQKTIIIEEATGLSDLWQGSNRMVVFPNPSRNWISWSIDGQTKVAERVRIFSLNGQVIEEQLNVSQVSLKSIPSGVYFLEIQVDATRVATYRIIH